MRQRRRARSRLITGVVAAVLTLTGAAHADDTQIPENFEFYGSVELEGIGYFEDPQFPGQDRDTGSIAFEATLMAEWMNGDLVFEFTPFVRLDLADDRRTHGDIRALKLDYASGNWSATVGADVVFWGRTEAVHLVDIINQTDQVEGIDDEESLGQPMVRLAHLTDIGEFSAYYMPYFRERPFAGENGRLRFAVPVNTARPVYETDAEEWTPSFAGRYAGTFGPLDLGLSVFHGLSRDPSFMVTDAGVFPVYSRITQGGVDLQITTGATLWKAEGILREGQRNARFREETYGALTGGIEHTLFGVMESNADLGLIAEYAWDSRGDDALTGFQNDLILGTRLTFNNTQDTSLLFTGSIDTEDSSVGLRLEAEHRLSPTWSAELEAQGFLNQSRNTPQGSLADDSFMRLKLTYYY